MNINALRKKIERWHKRVEEMMVLRHPRFLFANPDLCLWIERHFRIGWRHLVKRGKRRGTLVVGLGWVTATVRW